MEELIDQIVRGTTPDARRALLRILVEVEKANANFEGVCRSPDVCGPVLALPGLVALRHAIAYSLVREAMPTADAALRASES